MKIVLKLQFIIKSKKHIEFKKIYTEIKIINYFQDNKDGIDSEKDNKKGRGSKSKVGKKSKSKEKSNNNQMDIEEEKDKKKEKELCMNLPELEINSEDTDDSLFLNALFNSILI